MIVVQPLRDAAERYRQSARSPVTAAVRSHLEEPRESSSNSFDAPDFLINKTQRSGPLGRTPSKRSQRMLCAKSREFQCDVSISCGAQMGRTLHRPRPSSSIHLLPAAPSVFRFRETFKFFICNCCKPLLTFPLSVYFCQRFMQTRSINF